MLNWLQVKATHLNRYWTFPMGHTQTNLAFPGITWMQNCLPKSSSVVPRCRLLKNQKPEGLPPVSFSACPTSLLTSTVSLCFQSCLLVFVCLAALGHSCCLRDLHCPVACRILIPWPGIEPEFPALQVGLLTTGLPGKSHSHFLVFCLPPFSKVSNPKSTPPSNPSSVFTTSSHTPLVMFF